MYELSHKLEFKPAITAAAHGLLAYGGDLSVDRLLLAYRSGIFPWYNDSEPICWWSPDPRMVFNLQEAQPMRITKSLRQSRRNKGYEIRENTAFRKVMHHCASVPRGDEHGTWIHDEMIAAYTNLHKLGYAVSIEVFKDDLLIGGLYGVDIPEKRLFCGESMFSLASDASKIALWYWIDKLKARGYNLLDAQLYNDHLASLGAVTIDRAAFIEYLDGF